MTLNNSTISGNSIDTTGGGIFVQGSAVSLNNVTIANNSARAAGGGISRINGLVNIRNTIIANNDNPTSPDVFGRFTDLGNNLIGTSDGSIGFNVSTLVGMIANPINPRLSSLQDNGGSTPTQALLPNSPAINAGAVSRVSLVGELGILYPILALMKQFESPLAVLLTALIIAMWQLSRFRLTVLQLLGMEEMLRSTTLPEMIPLELVLIIPRQRGL